MKKNEIGLENRINEFQKKMIIGGLVSFGSSIALCLGFFANINGFLGEKAGLVYNLALPVKILILIFSTVLVTTLTLLVTNIKLYIKLLRETDSIADKNCKGHSDSICQLLNDAYEGRRYEEVIKIGMQLSTPLWYTGKFELTAKVGEIVESAAIQTGNKRIQARVLIETIGWTSIRLGHREIGKQTIERGLQIAKDINDCFWIASAYRNLADIHLGLATSDHNLRYSNGNEPIRISVDDQQEQFAKCLEYLNLAKECAEKITVKKKKNELDGNIFYTFSKLFFEERKYEQALEDVERSQKCYAENEDSIEKQIKLYNLKGEILLRMHKREEAYIAFQEGFTKATEHNVNVHIVSNALSLADYFSELKQNEQAMRMLRKAREYISAVTDPLLIAKLEHLVQRIQNDEKA